MLRLHKQKHITKGREQKTKYKATIQFIGCTRCRHGRGQNALLTRGQTFCRQLNKKGCKKLSSTRKSRPAGQKQFLRPGDDVAANRRHSIQLENTTCSYCWCCCVFISPDTMQKASDCQDLRINNEYSATQSSSEQLRAKATTRLAGWQHPYAALTAKEKYCESNSARWKKERRKQEKNRALPWGIEYVCILTMQLVWNTHM